MEERDAEAVLLLASSLAVAGKYGEAAVLLHGLAAANGSDVRVERLLTRVFLAAGRYAEAEPIAVKLVQKTEGADLLAALFFHAHALWGCGKLDECKRQVERYAAVFSEMRPR